MLLKPLSVLGNQLLQHNDLITSLKWSPCGGYLASCSHDGLLRLWDGRNFQLVNEYSTNHERLQSLEWTPDGLGIIFVDDNGCVHRFSMITNCVEWTTKITPYALTSLYLDEGIIYCADRSGHIHKCNSETGLRIASHNKVNQVTPKAYFSIDERYVIKIDRQEYVITDIDAPEHIIAMGSSISILSSDVNSLLVKWQEPEVLFQSWPNAINSIFKADKDRLISCSADGSISVLANLTLKTIIKMSFGQDIPMAGCFLTNSNEAAIAFSSGFIRILSVQDLSIISEIRVAEVSLISICEISNRIVAGCSDSNIYLFNHKQSEQLPTKLLGHIWHVTALAQCPVSGRFASGSKDYSIRIWEPDEHGFHEYSVRTFGSTDYVETLCWMNNTKILSGSQDGRVIVWNVKNGNGQLLHTMRGWISSISYLTDRFIVIVDNKNQGIYGYVDEDNCHIRDAKIFSEAVITSFVYHDNQMEIPCLVASNGSVYTYSRKPSSNWILCKSDFSNEIIKRISVSANGRFACILRESFALEVWSISISQGLIFAKEREIVRPNIDVTCLAISNDGLDVSVGGWSRYLELYHGSMLQTQVPMPETVRCVSYTPDEKFQIVGAWNGYFAVIGYNSQIKEIEGNNRGRGLSVAVCSSSDEEVSIAFGNADTTVTTYKLDYSILP